jgi:hypothetical protein
MSALRASSSASALRSSASAFSPVAQPKLGLNYREAFSDAGAQMSLCLSTRHPDPQLSEFGNVDGALGIGPPQSRPLCKDESIGRRGRRHLCGESSNRTFSIPLPGNTIITPLEGAAKCAQPRPATKAPSFCGRIPDPAASSSRDFKAIETSRQTRTSALPFCGRSRARLRSNLARADHCSLLRRAGKLQRMLQSQGRKLAHRLRRKSQAAAHPTGVDETSLRNSGPQPVRPND